MGSTLAICCRHILLSRVSFAAVRLEQTVVLSVSLKGNETCLPLMCNDANPPVSVRRDAERTSEEGTSIAGSSLLCSKHHGGGPTASDKSTTHTHTLIRISKYALFLLNWTSKPCFFCSTKSDQTTFLITTPNQKIDKSNDFHFNRGKLLFCCL